MQARQQGLILDWTGSSAMRGSAVKSVDTSTLAHELEQFRPRCFWWVLPSVALVDLPRRALVQGLQTHGGLVGMLLAARL
jgi:hypothetical protein